MPAQNYCRCPACKRQKRRGYILGTRRTYSGGNSGMHGVSDYVPFPRFQSGHRVRRPGNTSYSDE